MELGKSRKTISAIIKSRKDRNVIEREGSDRNGIWIIKQMTLNRVQKSKKVPASIMNAKAKRKGTPFGVPFLLLSLLKVSSIATVVNSRAAALTGTSSSAACGG